MLPSTTLCKEPATSFSPPSSHNPLCLYLYHTLCPQHAALPLLPTPSPSSIRTALSARSTLTAHTLVMTKASTVSAPPAITALLRCTGACRPVGAGRSRGRNSRCETHCTTLFGTGIPPPHPAYTLCSFGSSLSSFSSQVPPACICRISHPPTCRKQLAALHLPTVFNLRHLHLHPPTHPQAAA